MSQRRYPESHVFHRDLTRRVLGIVRVVETAAVAAAVLSTAACGPEVTTSGAGGTGGGGTGTTTDWPACTAQEPFCRQFGGSSWTEEKADVTWDQADAYCKSIGGELPGISALRTLFVDCPGTVPGGPCTVTDSCNMQSCLNDACGGCGDGGHNVFGSENVYWSSTVNADVPSERFAAVYRYSLVYSTDPTKSLSAYCIQQ